MDFAEYSKIPAVNWSTLKEMRRSPLHYKYRLEHAREDTARLALGRAVHTSVLEPDMFPLHYAVYKGGIRRGKAWDAFHEQHATETILKPAEYQICLDIRNAVRRHPVAAEYLRAGVGESTLQWRDPESGLACKARPDWISESKPALVDLKTTASVDAGWFSSNAAKMGYFGQLAFYRDGIMCSRGVMMPAIVIAVEAAAPHDVVVYEIDEDSMYAGGVEYAELLARVKECTEKGRWPGRNQEQQVLRAPAWAWPDDDEDATGLDLIISGQSTNSNGEVNDGTGL